LRTSAHDHTHRHDAEPGERQVLQVDRHEEGHMSPRARRGPGEEGASLLLAIIFMLVFSLILTAVLQFSATSFKTANVVNDRNRASYAASGAVDALVQRLRRDPSRNAGRSGQTCGSATFSGADS